ncbi:hypothetical protein [Streptomyces sp. NBC_00576]|uniref:hypothetical protein n=1 Tax=Streptomyces sp. NBC_00576 TaxID=2903665 RepID=UPI002E8180D1|nr:hypothetical protein [Streptomyces sp. NBC_00576]
MPGMGTYSRDCRTVTAPPRRFALAAAFHTADVFTTDGHFRMMRPLTGQPSFRLLPDDL